MRTSHLIAIAAAATIATVAGDIAAKAQTYPERSIRLVIPYPPGGSSDTIGRLIADKISGPLGQTVVVENIGGAAASIGAAEVAKAEPDGYTLLFSATPVSTNTLLYSSLPYSMSDFVPVAGVAKTVNVLSIHESVPADNFEEFMEYAKAHQGELNFASSGQGGLLHLITEKFMSVTDLDLVHVPYQGAGPAWVDYVAGRIQVYFDSALASIPHAEAGEIKLLGVGNEERISSLPDVPTMAELGYPMVAYAWYGVHAPAGTPKEAIDRLNKEINEAVASDEVVETLTARGGVGLSGSPEEFTKFVEEDYAYWESIVKPLNITLD